MKRCRLCGKASAMKLFDADLLGRKVSYFDCTSCGYVQTEEPTWLGEAYASTINSSDTGIMARNLSNVSLVLATLTLMGRRKSQVVDYAGGHGFLVRLLRDIGIDALWTDPYSENLVVRGFEYEGSGEPILTTAFEAFEHFVSPVEEMEKLLGIAPNILLTTNLIDTPAPKPNNWWYYGLDHGQHIGFYRLQTLQYLADNFGLHLLTDGFSTHLFSQEKYSFRAWYAFRQVARRMPKLFQLGLSSKTWDDHLCISK
jgi:hypothetical protein